MLLMHGVWGFSQQAINAVATPCFRSLFACLVKKAGLFATVPLITYCVCHVLCQPYVAQAQPGVSNGRNRPPNRTSAQLADVAKVTADVTASIQAVESQIKQVVEETKQVQQDKGEGWQAELAYLQNHQQWLAVEKEQLQGQLRQLQEKSCCC
jgi:hypothetical protein